MNRGPLVICKRGEAATGNRTAVTRRFYDVGQLEYLAKWLGWGLIGNRWINSRRA